MDHDERITWAQFRFSVIAPLVCRKFESDEQKKALRREILQQTYVQPDGVASGLKAQQMRWQNFSHQIQKRAADICSPLLYLMRSYRKSGTLLLGLAFHHTDIANVV